MEQTSPSFLTPSEQSVIETVASELEDPRLTPERRNELLRTIDAIAERYACDSRLAEY